jgi:hypothetical protein
MSSLLRTTRHLITRASDFGRQAFSRRARLPIEGSVKLARALLCTAALLALAAPAAGAAPARPFDPDLWATVNLCDTPQRPGAMGIRVSLPPRYRHESQWMRVQVQWYDLATGQWKLLRAGGDTGWKKIGNGRRLVQSGTIFKFNEPAAGRYLLLRGLVDVQWRRRGHMTGTARTTTLPGHADPGDPLLAQSHRGCIIHRAN